MDFPTILCVEDEPSLLMLRQIQLERAGYRVLTAATPAEALRACAAEHVDLVLTDYWLPGMSGVALGWLLKRNYPDVVIMLVTGALDLDADPRAIDMVLPKPTEEGQLLSSIAELLRPAQEYGT